MIYKDLIVHSSTYKKLISFYNMNRLPNAFIFHGNAGIGKEAHAIEFFGYLNCKEPEKDRACGSCESCKKTKILQHEYLQIITPLPRSKPSKNNSSLDVLNEKQRIELLNHLKNKGENPYYKIEVEKANTILVNSIKEIKKNINLSIPKNKIKLYLIFDAEKLCYPNQEAANALLKILEEPNENHLFILVTSNLNKMIDTVKSRCISIYFNNIEPKKLEKFIVDKNQIDNNKAKIISKISMGDITYAESLINTYNEKINSIEILVNCIISNNISDWNSTFKKMPKKGIIDLLNLLNIFFRDLNNLKKNDSKTYLANFENFYIDLLKTYSHINWEIPIKLTNNCLEYIQRNGYQNLIITSLLLEIRHTLENDNKLIFDINQWTAYNG